MTALAVSLVAWAAAMVAAFMAGRVFGWNRGAEAGYEAGYSDGFDEGTASLGEATEALRTYGLRLLPAVSSDQDGQRTSDTPTSTA